MTSNFRSKFEDKTKWILSLYYIKNLCIQQSTLYNYELINLTIKSQLFNLLSQRAVWHFSIIFYGNQHHIFCTFVQWLHTYKGYRCWKNFYMPLNILLFWEMILNSSTHSSRYNTSILIYSPKLHIVECLQAFPLSVHLKNKSKALI